MFKFSVISKFGNQGCVLEVAASKADRANMTTEEILREHMLKKTRSSSKDTSKDTTKDASEDDPMGDGSNKGSDDAPSENETATTSMRSKSKPEAKRSAARKLKRAMRAAEHREKMGGIVYERIGLSFFFKF